MPKYFEFVFAAYGIWIGVFAVYLVLLIRKSRRVRRAMEDIARHASPPGSRS